MKFDENLPKCRLCGHSTELLADPAPKEGGQSIRYFIQCTSPDCSYKGVHLWTKPGPWRRLARLEWPCGMRCPNCSEPVEFATARKRTDCHACGARVDKDGKFGLVCDHCGGRHWSEEARANCIFFAMWRMEGEEMITTYPEMAPRAGGTTEPNPFGPAGWDAIRRAVLKRDALTCQDCGRNDPQRLRHIKVANIDEFEVHHIVPRMAGGTSHPANLATLCRECHLERHKVIGDGYSTHFDVAIAIIRGEMDEEERARLLAGDHPILEEINWKKEVRALPKKERELQEALHSGAQKTLEVDG